MAAPCRDPRAHQIKYVTCLSVCAPVQPLLDALAWWLATRPIEVTQCTPCRTGLLQGLLPPPSPPGGSGSLACFLLLGAWLFLIGML